MTTPSVLRFNATQFTQHILRNQHNSPFISIQTGNNKTGDPKRLPLTLNWNHEQYADASQAPSVASCLSIDNRNIWAFGTDGLSIPNIIELCHLLGIRHVFSLDHQLTGGFDSWLRQQNGIISLEHQSTLKILCGHFRNKNAQPLQEIINSPCFSSGISLFHTYLKSQPLGDVAVLCRENDSRCCTRDAILVSVLNLIQK